MSHVFVRPARPTDAKQFTDWSLLTANNLYDSDTMPYTKVFCAYNHHGVLAYAPVQQPIMMEALAINPENKPSETAVALKELVQALVTQAHVNNVGEIYFLCKDESTIKYAVNQGFEELPWRLCRLKIADLEKEKPNA